MAYNELNNEESGLVIRQKINEMFAEIYTILFGGDDSSGQIPLNLWTIFEDALTPVDDIEVRVKLLKAIEGLNIADLFTINAAGDIHINSLAPDLGLRVLAMGETGQVVAMPLSHLQTRRVFSNTTLNFADDVVFVTAAANTTITLPVISTCVGRAYMVRKIAGIGSVILTTQGTDKIGTGATLASTFALPSISDWVVVRATQNGSDYIWEIESNGGGTTTAGGGGVSGGGYIKITANTANLEIEYPFVGAGAEGSNVYLNLPQISSVGSVQFTIRKNTASAYVVSINRSGYDLITRDTTDTNEIYTVEQGACIQLVSDVDTQRWYVMNERGTWL